MAARPEIDCRSFLGPSWNLLKIPGLLLLRLLLFFFWFISTRHATSMPSPGSTHGLNASSASSWERGVRALNSHGRVIGRRETENLAVPAGEEDCNRNMMAGITYRLCHIRLKG